MGKILYFDMDGTIADLYGVEGWLEDLQAEKTRPYIEARPLVNTIKFNLYLYLAARAGYKFGVISWLSKGGSARYNEEVTVAKKEWLARYFPILAASPNNNFLPYGTPKHKVAARPLGVLVDDDKGVGCDWVKSGGVWVHANEVFDWLESVAG